MSQKITYTLDFKANVTDVQGQLDRLKTSLRDLASKPLSMGNGTITKELREASQAAIQMQKHLQFAMDPLTGKMDLSRLNVAMKNSGMSVQNLSQKLLGAGQEGKKAFFEIANAVANAQKPMLRTNAMMDKLWDTMKNTARWQLSSSLLTGFTSSLSEAVHFAKDLNTALNDIRIVSGDSAEQMKTFSKQANQMAKDLKASTVDVVKGTLIYKQQGDTTEQAMKKAEITAKAANVTTESTAEEMSEHLTAIWNSYQVGSGELEIFVDKLAYVGATTATSMEEIATSMTKVAATAHSVGVEYDQLLGIISTVSSATRTSAESVGTSFKTILARMGDLKLEGSVDEDGVTTTLGEVSSALKSVGVDVLDANGDIRDMGTVIEELGDKWQTMNKNQQVAIAEVVAGKRQYTNLISLFDNWDKYKTTIEGAANAQGTLNEQNKIYLESWEGASQAVKTATEGLVMDFINDEAVVDIINFLAKLIEFIDKAVEAMGGFETIIFGISALFIHKFAPQISASLQSAGSAIMTFLGKSSKMAQQTATDFNKVVQEWKNNSSISLSDSEQRDLELLVDKGKFYQEHGQALQNMDSIERDLYELRLKQIMLNSEQEAHDKVEAAQRERELAEETKITKEKEKQQLIERAIASKGKHNKISSAVDVRNAVSEFNLDAESILKARAYPKSGIGGNKAFANFLKQAPTGGIHNLSATSFQEIEVAMRSMTLSGEEQKKVMEALSQSVFGTKDGYEQYKQKCIECENAEKNLTNATNKEAEAQNNANKSGERRKENLRILGDEIDRAGQKSASFTDKLTGGSQVAMSAGMAFSSVANIFSQLSNAIQTGEFDLVSFLSSLLMGLPMILGSLTSLTTAYETMGIKAASAWAKATLGLSILIPFLIEAAKFLPTPGKIVDDALKSAETLKKETSELENINNELDEKQKRLNELLSKQTSLTDEEKIETAELRDQIRLLEHKKKLKSDNIDRLKEKTTQGAQKAAKELSASYRGFAGWKWGGGVSDFGSVIRDEEGNIDLYSQMNTQVRQQTSQVWGYLNPENWQYAFQGTQYIQDMLAKDLDTSNEDSWISKAYEIMELLDPDSQEYKQLEKDINDRIEAYDLSTSRLQAEQEYKDDHWYWWLPGGSDTNKIEERTKELEKERKKEEEKKRKEAEAAAKAQEKSAKIQDTYTNSIENLTGALGELKDSFSTMNDVYSEFINKGKVSYSTLEKFLTEFKDIDGVEFFAGQLAEGKMTVEQFNTMMSDFIYQRVEEEIFTKKTLVANKALIQAYLEEMGVKNAAEAATQIYNKAKFREGLQNIDLTKSYDQVKKEVDELGASYGYTSHQSQLLFLQQKLLDVEKLDFSQQLTALGDLANQLTWNIGLMGAHKRAMEGLAGGYVFLQGRENVWLDTNKIKANYPGGYDGFLADLKEMGLKTAPAINNNVVLQDIESGKQYIGMNAAKEYYTRGQTSAIENIFDEFPFNYKPPGDGGDEPAPLEPTDPFELEKFLIAKDYKYHKSAADAFKEELDAIDTDSEGFDKWFEKANHYLWEKKYSLEKLDKRKEEYDKLLLKYGGQAGLGETLEDIAKYFETDAEGNVIYGQFWLDMEKTFPTEEDAEAFREGSEKVKEIYDLIHQDNEELKAINEEIADFEKEFNYTKRIEAADWKISLNDSKFENFQSAGVIENFQSMYDLLTANEQEILAKYNLAVEQGNQVDIEKYQKEFDENNLRKIELYGLANDELEGEKTLIQELGAEDNARYGELLKHQRNNLKAQLKIARATGDEVKAREILVELVKNYAEEVQHVTDKFNKEFEIAQAISDELVREIELEKENTEYDISRQEHRISLYDTLISSNKKLREVRKSINDQLRESMLNEKYLSETEREKIFNARDYLTISSKIADIEKSNQKLYRSYQQQINKLQDDELYKAERITAEYKVQVEQKERELEILKQELDLMNKRQALTDALAEKNVRVFQGGRWTFMANHQNVQTALKNYEDAAYNLTEKRIENEEQLQKEELESYKRYLEELNKARDAEIGVINDSVEALELKFKKWNAEIPEYTREALDEHISNGEDILIDNWRLRGVNRDNILEPIRLYSENVDYMSKILNADSIEEALKYNELRNKKIKGLDLDEQAYTEEEIFLIREANKIRSEGKQQYEEFLNGIELLRGKEYRQSIEEVGIRAGLNNLLYDGGLLLESTLEDFINALKEAARRINERNKTKEDYEDLDFTVSNPWIIPNLDNLTGGYASGSFSTIGGWAQVNEEGFELYGTKDGQFIELNPGEKIFNNEQFKYLYNISKNKTGLDYLPSSISNSMTVGEVHLTLPNVHDTESFIEGLRNLNSYLKNNNYS